MNISPGYDNSYGSVSDIHIKQGAWSEDISTANRQIQGRPSIESQRILEDWETPSTSELERDWNEEFQVLCERVVCTDEDEERYLRITSEFFTAFNAFAEKVVKVLVRQRQYDQDQWIYSPLDKGILGGQKFIVGRVFCKFARDDKGIFGDDSLAQKAAMNEIRGANAVLGCNIPHLHTPVMCTVRYQGHLVTVTSVMPIDSCSLLLGSDDGGKTIHNESPQLYGMLRDIAAQLNLKPHIVRALDQGSSPTKEVTMFIAGDCEGHQSKVDGRFYIVDLGRLFPPTSNLNPHRFVQQFTPKYMQIRKETGRPPLSSDAYTRFGVVDQNVHDAEVDEAVAELNQVYLPRVARDMVVKLSQQLSEDPKAEWKALSCPLEILETYASTSPRDLMKKEFGINMRFLSKLRLLIQGLSVSEIQMDTLANPDHFQAVIQLLSGALLQEMIIRAVKVEFYRIERPLLSAKDCDKAAKDMLGKVFCTYDASNEFWSQQLPDLLYRKYDDAKSSISKDDIMKIRSICGASRTFRGNLMLKMGHFYMGLDLHDNINEALLPQNYDQLLAWGNSALGAAVAFPSRKRDKVEETERYLLEEISIREGVLGKTHPKLMPTVVALLSYYLGREKLEEVERSLPWIKRMQDMCVNVTADLDPDESLQRGRCFQLAGMVYLRLRRFQKAEECMGQCMQMLKEWVRSARNTESVSLDTKSDKVALFLGPFKDPQNFKLVLDILAPFISAELESSIFQGALSYFHPNPHYEKMFELFSSYICTPKITAQDDGKQVKVVAPAAAVAAQEMHMFLRLGAWLTCFGYLNHLRGAGADPSWFYHQASQVYQRVRPSSPESALVETLRALCMPEEHKLKKQSIEIAKKGITKLSKTAPKYANVLLSLVKRGEL